MLPPLPIDPFVPGIVEQLRAARAVIIVASPGAGKTTRVPPALADDGAVILLQPRRVAARAITRRIAHERSWRVGREIGWHIRFERQFSSETQLLVATEGILTARLQQDPLLSAFRTIVLDEFHERSIHADLGIALARQAWRAREDLRIVVMSATLDATRVSAFLESCPVVDVPGTLHGTDIEYRAGSSVAEGVREIAVRTAGQILCFLPGVSEIRRTASELTAGGAGGIADVVELHGTLRSEEQDRALEVTPHRRVILATNIAETSLTVPGVTAVVDSGLHRVARYDARRGVDSLEIERISRDSADQRAGRAGRLGPGLVLRLWDERDRLPPHREPEIARIDLSGPVLDVLAWGGDPQTFEWFDPPSSGALGAALVLLTALGALDGGKLTAVGRKMARLSLHPRLARILIEAGGAPEAAAACALLSERVILPRHPPTTTCDLLVGESELPVHVRRNAAALQRAFGPSLRHSLGERELRRALLAGYPDRVARRRAPADPRLLLTSGHGASVGPESGVRDGAFLIALDVMAIDGPDARVRIASIVEPGWLKPTHTETVTEVDPESGAVRSTEREMYGAIVLRSRPTSVDPSALAAQLRDAFLGRRLSADDEQLVRRMRFAGIETGLGDLALRAAVERRRLQDVRLEDGLDWATRQRLEREAPPRIKVPSGRTHPLDYREDGTVALSVKLQELFGLAETPRIGSRREPLLIVLLAPNGRPVQTTKDLRNFWNSTYQDVRKELRGRYPKHPWPEDPWNATPTARTTKRV